MELPIKNKTWKYLAPILNSFETEFKKHLSRLRIIKYGIHDTLLDGAPDLQNVYCIYILVDSHYNPAHYKQAINWFSCHELFIDEYNPNEEITKTTRMLIFQIPKKFEKAYENFLKGKYSKMYTYKEIEKLFIKRDDVVKGVLLRDKQAFEEYLKLLRREFKLMFKSGTKFKDHEYDLPPLMEEEVFNIMTDKPVFFCEDVARKIYSKKDIKW